MFNNFFNNLSNYITSTRVHNYLLNNPSDEDLRVGRKPGLFIKLYRFFFDIPPEFARRMGVRRRGIVYQFMDNPYHYIYLYTLKSYVDLVDSVVKFITKTVKSVAKNERLHSMLSIVKEGIIDLTTDLKILILKLPHFFLRKIFFKMFKNFLDPNNKINFHEDVMPKFICYKKYFLPTPVSFAPFKNSPEDLALHFKQEYEKEQSYYIHDDSNRPNSSRIFYYHPNHKDIKLYQNKFFSYNAYQEIYKPHIKSLGTVQTQFSKDLELKWKPLIEIFEFNAQENLTNIRYELNNIIRDFNQLQPYIPIETNSLYIISENTDLVVPTETEEINNLDIIDEPEITVTSDPNINNNEIEFIETKLEAIEIEEDENFNLNTNVNELNDSFVTNDNFNKVYQSLIKIDDLLIKSFIMKYKTEAEYTKRINYIIDNEVSREMDENTNLFSRIKNYTENGSEGITNQHLDHLTQRYSLESEIHKINAENIKAILDVKRGYRILNKIATDPDVKKMYDFCEDLGETRSALSVKTGSELFGFDYQQIQFHTKLYKELRPIVFSKEDNSNLTSPIMEQRIRDVGHDMIAMYRDFVDTLIRVEKEVGTIQQTIENAEKTINYNFKKLHVQLFPQLQSLEENNPGNKIVTDINEFNQIKSDYLNLGGSNNIQKKLDMPTLRMYNCFAQIDVLKAEQNKIKKEFKQQEEQINSFRQNLIGVLSDHKFFKYNSFTNIHCKSFADIENISSNIKKDILNQENSIKIDVNLEQQINQSIFEENENIEENEDSFDFIFSEETKKENNSSSSITNINKPIYQKINNKFEKVKQNDNIDILNTEITHNPVSYMKRAAVTINEPSAKLNFIKTCDTIFPIPLLQIALPSLIHYAITHNPYAFTSTIILVNKLNQRKLKDSSSSSMFTYNKNVKYDNLILEEDLFDDISKNKGIKLNFKINTPKIGYRIKCHSQLNYKYGNIDSNELKTRFIKKVKLFVEFKDRSLIQECVSNVNSIFDSVEEDTVLNSEELELLKTVVPNKLSTFIDETDEHIYKNYPMFMPGEKNMSMDDPHYHVYAFNESSKYFSNYSYAPLCLRNDPNSIIDNVFSSPDKNIEVQKKLFSKNFDIFSSYTDKNASKIKYEAIKMFAEHELVLSDIKKNLVFNQNKINVTEAFQIHRTQVAKTSTLSFNHNMYLQRHVLLGRSCLGDNGYKDLLSEYNFVYHRLQIIEKLDLGYTHEINQIFSEINNPQIKDIISNYNNCNSNIIELPNISLNNDINFEQSEINDLKNSTTNVINNITIDSTLMNMDQTMFELHANINNERFDNIINRINNSMPEIPFYLTENFNNIMVARETLTEYGEFPNYLISRIRELEARRVRNRFFLSQEDRQLLLHLEGLYEQERYFPELDSMQELLITNLLEYYCKEVTKFPIIKPLLKALLINDKDLELSISLDTKNVHIIRIIKNLTKILGRGTPEFKSNLYFKLFEDSLESEKDKINLILKEKYETDKKLYDDNNKDMHNDDIKKSSNYIKFQKRIIDITFGKNAREFDNKTVPLPTMDIDAEIKKFLKIYYNTLKNNNNLNFVDILKKLKLIFRKDKKNVVNRVIDFLNYKHYLNNKNIKRSESVKTNIKPKTNVKFKYTFSGIKKNIKENITKFDKHRDSLSRSEFTSFKPKKKLNSLIHVDAKLKKIIKINTKEELLKLKSGKKEPVKLEPVKKEPVKLEPVKLESVKKEPVKLEPIKKEPVKLESVKKEPVKKLKTIKFDPSVDIKPVTFDPFVSKNKSKPKSRPPIKILTTNRSNILTKTKIEPKLKPKSEIKGDLDLDALEDFISLNLKIEAENIAKAEANFDAKLDAEVAKFDAEYKYKAEDEAKLGAELAELDAEFEDELAKLDPEFKAELTKLDSEFDAEIYGLETGLDKLDPEYEAKLIAKLTKLDAILETKDKLEAELDAEDEAKIKAELLAAFGAENKAELAKLDAEFNAKLKAQYEAGLDAELGAELDAELQAELTEYEAKLDKLNIKNKAEYEAKIAKFEAECEAKVAKVEANFDPKFSFELQAKLHAELDVELSKLESKLKMELDELDFKCAAEVAELDAEFKAKLTKLDAKLNAKNMFETKFETKLETELKSELAEFDVETKNRLDVEVANLETEVSILDVETKNKLEVKLDAEIAKIEAELLVALDAETKAENKAEFEAEFEAEIAKIEAELFPELDHNAIPEIDESATPGFNYNAILDAQYEAELDAELDAQYEAKLQAELEAEYEAEFLAQYDAQYEAEIAKLEAGLDAETKNILKAEFEAELAKLDAELDAELETDILLKLDAENRANFEAEANAKINASFLSFVIGKSNLEAENYRKADASTKAKIDAANIAILQAEINSPLDSEFPVFIKESAELSAENQAKLDAESKAENLAKLDAELLAELEAELVTPVKKKEPIKNEPIKKEPVKLEPVKKEPVKLEPIKKESVKLLEAENKTKLKKTNVSLDILKEAVKEINIEISSNEFTQFEAEVSDKINVVFETKNNYRLDPEIITEINALIKKDKKIELNKQDDHIQIYNSKMKLINLNKARVLASKMINLDKNNIKLNQLLSKIEAQLKKTNLELDIMENKAIISKNLFNNKIHVEFNALVEKNIELKQNRSVEFHNKNIELINLNKARILAIKMINLDKDKNNIKLNQLLSKIEAQLKKINPELDILKYNIKTQSTAEILAEFRDIFYKTKVAENKSKLMQKILEIRDINNKLILKEKEKALVLSQYKVELDALTDTKLCEIKAKLDAKMKTKLSEYRKKANDEFSEDYTNLRAQLRAELNAQLEEEDKQYQLGLDNYNYRLFNDLNKDFEKEFHAITGALIQKHILTNNKLSEEGEKITKKLELLTAEAVNIDKKITHAKKIKQLKKANYFSFQLADIENKRVVLQSQKDSLSDALKKGAIQLTSELEDIRKNFNEKQKEKYEGVYKAHVEMFENSIRPKLLQRKQALWDDFDKKSTYHKSYMHNSLWKIVADKEAELVVKKRAELLKIKTELEAENNAKLEIKAKSYININDLNTEINVLLKNEKVRLDEEWVQRKDYLIKSQEEIYTEKYLEKENSLKEQLNLLNSNLIRYQNKLQSNNFYNLQLKKRFFCERLDEKIIDMINKYTADLDTSNKIIQYSNTIVGYETSDVTSMLLHLHGTLHNQINESTREFRAALSSKEMLTDLIVQPDLSMNERMKLLGSINYVEKTLIPQTYELLEKQRQEKEKLLLKLAAKKSLLEKHRLLEIEEISKRDKLIFNLNILERNKTKLIELKSKYDSLIHNANNEARWIDPIFLTQSKLNDLDKLKPRQSKKTYDSKVLIHLLNNNTNNKNITQINNFKEDLLKVKAQVLLLNLIKFENSENKLKLLKRVYNNNNAFDLFKKSYNEFSLLLSTARSTNTKSRRYKPIKLFEDLLCSIQKARQLDTIYIKKLKLEFRDLLEYYYVYLDDKKYDSPDIFYDDLNHGIINNKLITQKILKQSDKYFGHLEKTDEFIFLGMKNIFNEFRQLGQRHKNENKILGIIKDYMLYKRYIMFKSKPIHTQFKDLSKLVVSGYEGLTTLQMSTMRKDVLDLSKKYQFFLSKGNANIIKQNRMLYRMVIEILKFDKKNINRLATTLKYAVKQKHKLSQYINISKKNTSKTFYDLFKQISVITKNDKRTSFLEKRQNIIKALCENEIITNNLYNNIIDLCAASIINNKSKNLKDILEHLIPTLKDAFWEGFNEELAEEVGENIFYESGEDLVEEFIEGELVEVFSNTFVKELKNCFFNINHNFLNMTNIFTESEPFFIDFVANKNDDFKKFLLGLLDEKKTIPKQPLLGLLDEKKTITEQPLFEFKNKNILEAKDKIEPPKTYFHLIEKEYKFRGQFLIGKKPTYFDWVETTEPHIPRDKYMVIRKISKYKRKKCYLDERCAKAFELRPTLFYRDGVLIRAVFKPRRLTSSCKKFYPYNMIVKKNKPDYSNIKFEPFKYKFDEGNPIQTNIKPKSEVITLVPPKKSFASIRKEMFNVNHKTLPEIHSKFINIKQTPKIDSIKIKQNNLYKKSNYYTYKHKYKFLLNSNTDLKNKISQIEINKYKKFIKLSSNKKIALAKTDKSKEIIKNLSLFKHKLIIEQTIKSEKTPSITPKNLINLSSTVVENKNNMLTIIQNIVNKGFCKSSTFFNSQRYNSLFKELPLKYKLLPQSKSTAEHITKITAVLLNNFDKNIAGYLKLEGKKDIPITFDQIETALSSQSMLKIAQIDLNIFLKKFDGKQIYQKLSHILSNKNYPNYDEIILHAIFSNYFVPNENYTYSKIVNKFKNLINQDGLNKNNFDFDLIIDKGITSNSLQLSQILELFKEFNIDKMYLKDILLLIEGCKQNNLKLTNYFSLDLTQFSDLDKLFDINSNMSLFNNFFFDKNKLIYNFIKYIYSQKNNCSFYDINRSNIDLDFISNNYNQLTNNLFQGHLDFFNKHILNLKNLKKNPYFDLNSLKLFLSLQKDNYLKNTSNYQKIINPELYYLLRDKNLYDIEDLLIYFDLDPIDPDKINLAKISQNSWTLEHKFEIIHDLFKNINFNATLDQDILIKVYILLLLEQKSDNDIMLWMLSEDYIEKVYNNIKTEIAYKPQNIPKISNYENEYEKNMLNYFKLYYNGISKFGDPNINEILNNLKLFKLLANNQGFNFGSWFKKDAQLLKKSSVIITSNSNINLANDYKFNYKFNFLSDLVFFMKMMNNSNESLNVFNKIKQNKEFGPLIEINSNFLSDLIFFMKIINNSNESLNVFNKIKHNKEFEPLTEINSSFFRDLYNICYFIKYYKIDIKGYIKAQFTSSINVYINILNDIKRGFLSTQNQQRLEEQIDTNTTSNNNNCTINTISSNNRLNQQTKIKRSLETIKPFNLPKIKRSLETVKPFNLPKIKRSLETVKPFNAIKINNNCNDYGIIPYVSLKSAQIKAGYIQALIFNKINTINFNTKIIEYSNLIKHYLDNLKIIRPLTMTPNYLINRKIVIIKNIIDELQFEAEVMLNLNCFSKDNLKLYYRLFDIKLPKKNKSITSFFEIPFYKISQSIPTLNQDNIIFKLLNIQKIEPQVKMNIRFFFDLIWRNGFGEYMQDAYVAATNNIFLLQAVKVEDKYPFLNLPLKQVGANILIKVNNGINFTFRFLGVKGNLTQITIFTDNSYISFFHILKLKNIFFKTKGLFLIPNFLTKKTLKTNKTLLVRNKTQCYFIKQYELDNNYQINHDIYIITGDSKPVQAFTKLSSYNEMLNPEIRSLLQFDFGYIKLENMPFKTPMNSKFTLNIDYRIHVDKSFSSAPKIGLYLHFNKLLNTNSNLLFAHLIKQSNDFISIFGLYIRGRIRNNLLRTYKTHELLYDKFKFKFLFFEQKATNLFSYQKHSINKIFLAEWRSILQTSDFMKLSAQWLYMYRNREFIKNVNRKVYNMLKTYNTVDKIYAAPYKNYTPFKPVCFKSSLRYILFSKLNLPNASAAYLPKFLFENKDFRLLKIFANLNIIRRRLKNQLEYYLYLREYKSFNRIFEKIKLKGKEKYKLPFFDHFFNQNIKMSLLKEFNLNKYDLSIKTNNNLLANVSKLKDNSKDLDKLAILQKILKFILKTLKIRFQDFISFVINKLQMTADSIFDFYQGSDIKNLLFDFRRFTDYIYIKMRKFKALINKEGWLIFPKNKLFPNVKAAHNDIKEEKMELMKIIHSHKIVIPYWNYNFTSIFSQLLWSYHRGSKFIPLINITPSEMPIFSKGQFLNITNNLGYKDLFILFIRGDKYSFLLKSIKPNELFSKFNKYLLNSSKTLLNCIINSENFFKYRLNLTKNGIGIASWSVQNNYLFDKVISPRYRNTHKFLKRLLDLNSNALHMDKRFFAGIKIIGDADERNKMPVGPLSSLSLTKHYSLEEYYKYDTFKIKADLNTILNKKKNTFKKLNKGKINNTIELYKYRELNIDSAPENHNLAPKLHNLVIKKNIFKNYKHSYSLKNRNIKPKSKKKYIFDLFKSDNNKELIKNILKNKPFNPSNEIQLKFFKKYNLSKKNALLKLPQYRELVKEEEPFNPYHMPHATLPRVQKIRFKSSNYSGIDWKFFNIPQKFCPNVLELTTQVSSNIEEYVETIDQTENTKVPAMDQKNTTIITTKQKSFVSATKDILFEFYEAVNDFVQSDFFSWITFHEYREELLRNQTEIIPTGMISQVLLSFFTGTLSSFMVFAADYRRAPVDKRAGLRLFSFKFFFIFCIVSTLTFIFLHFGGMDIIKDLIKSSYNFFFGERIPQRAAYKPEFQRNYTSNPYNYDSYRTAQCTQYIEKIPKKQIKILIGIKNFLKNF